MTVPPHPPPHTLFRVPDVDFSPSKLQVITSNIHINLFDEVVVDILEDDRRRATTLHHRIEKRWLGKLILPFSTLILRQRVICGLEICLEVIWLSHYEVHVHSCKSSIVLIAGVVMDCCIHVVCKYLLHE